MRFKPGQQVVCIRPTKPFKVASGPDAGKMHTYGPKYNELVTVQEITPYGEGVTLFEYPGDPFGNPLQIAYSEKSFEPLVSDAVLSEQLATVPEPFTI